MQGLKLVLFGLVCLVCISGCSRLFGFGNGNCEANSVGVVRITPPNGAEVINESCSTGINPTQRITFTIEPDQLQEIQDSVQITDWQENPPLPDSFEDEAASMSSYIYGHYADGAVDLDMLIDTSNPQRYTVYYVGSFVD